MYKCLGFGGVGDCFIIILKLLEQKFPLIYTHIDVSASRLKLSEQLLNFFDIKHNCLVVSNIKEWWYNNHKDFDKCFNVFAKGYIDIPIRPYHWQPCKDEGYSVPFAFDVPNKSDLMAVQVNSGGKRNYKHKPVIEYVYNNYDKNKIVWFGTDTNFNPKYGINYCGKLNFIQTLKKIAICSYFVGFNSVLLYWALYNKTSCYLFTDHQGKEDLRIHDEWKKLLTYDI